MIDPKKLKMVKIAGYVVGIILAVAVGIVLGQSALSSQTKQETTKTTKTAKTSTLTQKQVTNFLLNYYTKKDLGENRNRYKEYMTDALYQQTVATEDEPQNQTYKGFVVDFEFKNADIYINEDSLEVIAQVTYVNTLLDEKKNYDTAQTDVVNTATLRLTYVKENDKYKVNKIENIILTDQTGDYGTLDSSTEATETSTETEGDN
ncbi:hypothetical protein SAMN04487839_12013 [Streptococcus gallolyticus]|uniref:Parvulin-like peptidyl-prolyl isomerase n=1 Tax=Streptococcus gallolyticus TaxID=315405 RepID=A0A1H7XWK8_9STRE|nr:hypothetical protein [Streptococcus gallolyticus]SEF25572.1 hypothetical protein SAMN02910295_0210 [Streptococcus gallolyticus]SEM38083.1 hypothetical protein SAMN04487839_12013 [Streptococcus gallolyticus]